MAAIASSLAFLASVILEGSLSMRDPSPGVRYVGHMCPAGPWSLDWHAHATHHEVIVVMRGRIQTKLRGPRGQMTIEGVAGQALFYPRGHPHAERSVGPAHLETIFVSWDGLWSDTRDWPLRFNDGNGRLTLLAQWMLELTPPARPDDAKTRDGLMLAMAHELQRQAHTEQDPGIGAALSLIRTRLADPIGLDDLANAAGMSRYHFARRFKHVVGVPPVAYLRRARIDAARTLLLSSDAPLRSIAAKVGLRDEFELSRAFKRVAGTSPGAARHRASRA
jgi:AraC-like DNA-binding protein/mannose-6-phosphate isomerase-like protein (cupin superfamily)